MTVANVYLSHPLLVLVGADFGSSAAATGAVSTAAQVGFAFGLLVFIPLGDAVRRRTLLSCLIAGATGALGLAAAAPGLPALVAATFAACAFTVVPQLLMPLAVELVPPARRPRVLATLQAGLLSGIFAARVVGGQIGEHASWRVAYLVAALATAVAGAATVAMLPAEPRRARVPYLRLLGSLPRLLRDQPVLRQACLLQSVSFGVFGMFWTTLVFLLTAAPFGFDTGTAAWFGLFGFASVVVAPFAGRLIDRYSASLVVGGGLVLATVAAGMLAVARLGVVVVALAVAVLNIGVQYGQIANQSRIFALDPGSRSRLNTVYMLIVFLGGALGTWLGTALYGHRGWFGVSAAGLVASVFGLACWGWFTRRRGVGREMADQPAGHE